MMSYKKGALLSTEPKQGFYLYITLILIIDLNFYHSLIFYRTSGEIIYKPRKEAIASVNCVSLVSLIYLYCIKCEF